MESSQLPENTTLTAEERANLKRSKRKGKRQWGLDLSIEEAMDGLATVPKKDMPAASSPERVKNFDPVKTRMSYRDTLTNGRVEKLTNAEGHEDEWKDWLDSEEDDQLLEKYEVVDGEEKEYP